MKNSIVTMISILVLVLGTYSCTKQQDDLVLNANHLFVADALEYCQGSCSDQLEWEGAEILVKGHVRDAASDAVMLEYYNDERFYLSDVRNGMFLEVRVIANTDPVFAILFGLKKSDMIYLRGTSESVIVNEGNECMKGVVIEISAPEDIKINL